MSLRTVDLDGALNEARKVVPWCFFSVKQGSRSWRRADVEL